MGRLQVLTATEESFPIPTSAASASMSASAETSTCITPYTVLLHVKFHVSDTWTVSSSEGQCRLQNGEFYAHFEIKICVPQVRKANYEHSKVDLIIMSRQKLQFVNVNFVWFIDMISTESRNVYGVAWQAKQGIGEDDFSSRSTCRKRLLCQEVEEKVIFILWGISLAQRNGFTYQHNLEAFKSLVTIAGESVSKL